MTSKNGAFFGKKKMPFVRKLVNQYIFQILEEMYLRDKFPAYHFLILNSFEPCTPMNVVRNIKTF
jgi:hypothetical protein